MLDEKEIKKIGDSLKNSLIPELVDLFATKQDFLEIKDELSELSELKIVTRDLASAVDKIAARLEILIKNIWYYANETPATNGG